ncbi:hypothetical protein B0H19DRAFT_1125325 [Mycena capillaripes]|nr:hypothetical protein B0H19DRAFT_1125325 [Mycena capillaripes]
MCWNAALATPFWFNGTLGALRDNKPTRETASARSTRSNTVQTNEDRPFVDLAYSYSLRHVPWHRSSKALIAIGAAFGTEPDKGR